MKQEDFIPGRWYRSTPEGNNRTGEIYYGKFLEFKNNAFVASSARVSGKIDEQQYTFSSGYIWELLTDLTEIQDLLFDNHPDKIMKTAPEAKTEVFGKFIIGNIVVSIRNNLPWREKGDMFMILPKSHQDMLYYKPGTCSPDRDDWRLATTEECDAYHNGVKNIKQMDSPKTTAPQQSVFLRNEYIVSLTDTTSGNFLKNHVYKQREDYEYLRVYKDQKDETNGLILCGFNDKHNWRYATSQEIMEYDIQNKPVDVTRIGMTPQANVIPSNAKKWAVRRTESNYIALNDWANSQPGVSGHSHDQGWIHSISYGFMGHSGDGHYYSDKIKHPDHTEISFEQWKMDHLDAPKINIEPIVNDPYAGKSLEEMLVICKQMFPKGCKYRKKGEGAVHILDEELTIQSAGSLSNGEKGISNYGLPWFFFNGTMRVELVSLPEPVLVVNVHKSSGVTTSWSHKIPDKSASDEEILAYCKKMYPIGTIIFDTTGKYQYDITEELFWSAGCFISHNGIPIVYDRSGHYFASIAGHAPKEESVTKTLKDLPKKATLSDVSALVKHQEPVIAFSKKAKRSKLVIINK